MINYFHWYTQTMKGTEPGVLEILRTTPEGKGRPWKGKAGAFINAFLLGGLFSIPGIGLLFKWIRDRTGIDVETEIRKKAPNQKLADALVSGLPGLMGVDSRFMLGFGYPIMPGASAGEVFIGAGWGMVKDAQQAVNYMREGQTLKAIGEIIPTAAERIVDAYLAKKEGLRWGDKVVVKNPSNLTLILRGIGLQPMDVSRRYKSREQLLFEQNWIKRRNRHYNRMYFEAKQTGNVKRVQAIKDVIRDWNKTHPRHLHLRISPFTQRRKAIERRVEGLPAPKHIPRQFRRRAKELEGLFR